MYCKNCKVTVHGDKTVCPLCKSPLCGEPEAPLFAKPELKKIKLKYFNYAFVIVMVLVNIACLVVNLLLDTSFLWSVMVVISSVYAYFALNFTVFTQNGMHKRILGQTIFLTVMIGFIRIFVDGNNWIYITWLPVVYVASDLSMLTLLIIKKSASFRYVPVFLLIAIFGAIIPVAAAYGFNLSVKWPAIAASCVNAFLLLALPVVYRKTIFKELKKTFHL